MKKRKNLQNLFCMLRKRVSGWARGINKWEILNVLEKMDKTDPSRRKHNRWDTEFIRLIPWMHFYDEVLEILNAYGFLSDMYFENLQGADQNVELQRNLCRVHYNEYIGDYRASYGNLLFMYLQRWDFLPEIKEDLLSDPKFKNVLYYCRSR